MPRFGSGLRGFGWGAAMIAGGGGLVAMLTSAADADNGIGEVRRESESFGAVDDLGGALAVDQRFRYDETRAQCTDSSIRGGSHTGHIPFNAGRSGESGCRQPTAVTGSKSHVTGSPPPDHHAFLTPILATNRTFRNPDGRSICGLSERTPLSGHTCLSGTLFPSITRWPWLRQAPGAGSGSCSRDKRRAPQPPARHPSQACPGAFWLPRRGRQTRHPMRIRSWFGA